MITTSAMSATRGLRWNSCGGLITLAPCRIKEFAGDEPLPKANADPDAAGPARLLVDVVEDALPARGNQAAAADRVSAGAPPKAATLIPATLARRARLLS